MASTLLGSLVEVVNRSPVSYESSSPFRNLLSGPSNKRTDQLAQMEAVSTLFGVVDRIASGVASVNWHLYRSAPSGKPEDRTEVTVHPALTVWNHPNPFYDQSAFIEASQQHYELTGERWWVIARSEMLQGQGPPVELWPVRPDRMTPVKDPEKFISGYVYDNGQDEVPLALDQVIYSKRQNPTNPYRGLSPIAGLMTDIQGEKAASEWNRNFFKNDATPGGMIQSTAEMSDKAYERLVEQWNRNHRGVSQAHRVGILEAATWQPAGYSHKDMQFGDMRMFTERRIMGAYTFPKSLLGMVDDVNRSNAESGEYVFARWLMVPRLVRLRDSLNQEFLPMFGSMGVGYEFDFEDPTPETNEDRREERNSAVDAAMALVEKGGDWDESLSAFGLPAITRTNGDELA